MKIFSKIYSIIVTAVTAFVLVIAGAISVPRLFGIRCYVVKSGSMEPAVSVGTLAYINTGNKKPAVEKIAVYKTSDDERILVMHRVYEITAEGYRFKGDANDEPDSGIVSPDRIVGTYIGGIPFAGKLVMRFSRPVIIMTIIAIIALNISVMIINRYTEKEDTDE